MAGIYIHVPFCKQACYYCNFHFSTSLRHAQQMADALRREISMRKDYAGGQRIETIYIGGGTPSLLGTAQLESLFNSIYREFSVSDEAEITLEANPDDLTPEKLSELRSLPVNRLSIGIQSFHEDDLRWMNRAHSALQALECVEHAQRAGFGNLSIDLIYGTPGLTDDKWMQNLQTAVSLGADHISSYALTAEPRTVLDTMIRKNQIPALNEEQAAGQFNMLVNVLDEAGFEQYEISNFARNGKYAVHNTSYWKGEHYLGVGPSAHSFNGHSRSWNIANNARYIRGVMTGSPDAETEQLTPDNRFNEYIMTGLRCKWGCDLGHIRKAFGEQYAQRLEKGLERRKDDGFILREGSIISLTKAGRLFADGIAADLFA